MMDDLWLSILGAAIIAALFDDPIITTDSGGWMYKGEQPYAVLIAQTEVQNGIPNRLLAALLYQESRFRLDIISGATRSSTGAMGIAQFMPATAVEYLGSAENALDPSKAIPGAGRYLKWLKGRLGSWRLAVIAYNWGIGNVQKQGIENLPAETTHYVSVVYDKLFSENQA